MIISTTRALPNLVNKNLFPVQMAVMELENYISKGLLLHLARFAFSKVYFEVLDISARPFDVLHYLRESPSFPTSSPKTFCFLIIHLGFACFVYYSCVFHAWKLTTFSPPSVKPSMLGLLRS